MKRRLLIPPWVLVAVGLVACDADAPLAPRAPRMGLRAPPPNAVSVWTLILTDTVGDVWIAQTNPGEPDTLTVGVWSGSATLWSRLDSRPVARDLTLHTTIVTRLDPRSQLGALGLLVSWQVDGSGTAWNAAGRGWLEVDRQHRTWRSTGWADEDVGGAGDALGREWFRHIDD